MHVTDPEHVQTLSVRRLMALVCCITIVATACSADAPDSIAFADDATTIEQPAVDDVTAEDLELITFHANWICELQRRTFDTLEDADEARAVALEGAAIDPVRYEDFIRVTLQDQLVRDTVMYEYQQRCRAE